MDSPAPSRSGDENTEQFSTPNANKGRLAELKDGSVDMSPKQTKLLARLHVLMKSFKELKSRVQTMQASGADGKGFSPDKKLFEKFREQKEAEIEALKASHEATVAAMKEKYENTIASLKEKHAHELEIAVAAAIEKAAAEKEAAILDVDFELKQEERQRELTDSERKREGASLERRQSSMAMNIHKALDEYPEELRGMLMMDGGLDVEDV